MTGNDLIASSMRLIGALASGETLIAAEASDALVILNQMLDSFNSERMQVFQILLNEFPLTPGQQTYTLGTGGNFNMTRPPRIERMGIVSLNNPAQPLELPLEMLTDKGWAAIPVKLIQSSLPQKVWDDGGFPFRNLNFWCVPNVPVNTRIYSWSALSSFPDLVTDMTFPPAYLRMLRYNLAVDLAPEFPGGDGQMLPLVMKTAAETKAMVKSQNSPLLEQYCDTSLTRNGSKPVYNWLSDNANYR